MTDRLTDLAFAPEYHPAAWTGENQSGIKPFGNTVLIMVDECRGRSAGNVIFTDDKTERMTLAAVTGAIAALGPFAFKGMAGAPVPGDRIYFRKFSGVDVIGMDGHAYRLMDDTALVGGLDERGKAAADVDG